MTARLEDIEAALFAELSLLRGTPPTDTAPFRMVDRWAGEVSADGVDEATLGRSPSALLAFERSTPDGREGAFVETAGSLVEVVERHLFRVYVTVVDTRGVKAATRGTVGQQGILLCTRLVKERLTGLDIDGLLGREGVRLVDHVPWSIDRGSHITHVLRFSARAELGVPAAEPTPGTPFVFDGDIQDPDETVTTSTARAPRD
ncbi:MAG: hypothetical protein R3A48_28970 [Polyangiales bacterium]